MSVGNNRRLVVPGKQSPVVGIMTGIVQECDIVTPCTEFNAQFRRIVIIPVSEEFDKAMKFIGSKYSKTTLYGPISNNVSLTFKTRNSNSQPCALSFLFVWQVA